MVSTELLEKWKELVEEVGGREKLEELIEHSPSYCKIAWGMVKSEVK